MSETTKQIVRFKELVAALVFLGGVALAAILFVVGVRDNLNEIENQLARVRQVQNYQMLTTAHQGNVLEHIAQKRNGDPPSKPSALRRAEWELLQ